MKGKCIKGVAGLLAVCMIGQTGVPIKAEKLPNQVQTEQSVQIAEGTGQILEEDRYDHIRQEGSTDGGQVPTQAPTQAPKQDEPNEPGPDAPEIHEDGWEHKADDVAGTDTYWEYKDGQLIQKWVLTTTATGEKTWQKFDSDESQAQSIAITEGYYEIDENGYYIYVDGSMLIDGKILLADGYKYVFGSDGTFVKKYKPVEEGWQQNKTGKWYQYEDGTWPANICVKIGDKFYVFNGSGYLRVKNWTKLDGKWYYSQADGVAWGQGWHKINNKWYYIDENCQMLYGWQKINNKWYWLGGADDGIMKYGWQKVGRRWYYLGAHNNDGVLRIGWQKINNKWYYLGSDPDSGAMQSGWQTVNGRRYYLDPKRDSVLQIGWQKIDGKWYYLGSDPNSGAMKTGWQKVKGKWYYLDPEKDGAMHTGWLKLGTKWYYLDPNKDGVLQIGWQKVGGKWYYLGSDPNSGAVKIGWQKIDGYWYYLGDDPDGGARRTGWQKIKDDWYYFYSDGKMAANVWIKKDYVDKNGVWIPDKKLLIAIDAGHQRYQNKEKEPIGPGASQTKPKVSSGTYGSASKINEYVLTLDVSLQLKEELIARGYDVYMIRETHDVNISNSQRAKMAAEAGADILVRIHANGDSNKSVYGALTMAPGCNNPYLSKSLISSSQTLSQKIIDSFCAATGAKNRGVEMHNDMSGINWSTIPVTIVEMGFMSNRNEDLKMASKSYQKKMVQGMANGIDAYFGRS